MKLGMQALFNTPTNTQHNRVQELLIYILQLINKTQLQPWIIFKLCYFILKTKSEEKGEGKTESVTWKLETVRELEEQP